MQIAYSFDKETMKKIGKGLLIAFAGVLATYLEDQIPNIDFGQYTSIAVAINSILVNTIKEFIKGIPTEEGRFEQ